MATQYDSRVAEIRANLRKVYGQATPFDRAAGEAWYPRAHKLVCEWADFYHLPIATVASVVAALSPQCRWDRNVVAAADVLAERPVSAHGPLPANVRKAEAIRRDRAASIMPYFKSAPKVASFQQNLQGNDEFVTIDTHAAQAGLNDPTAAISLTWNAYTVFATCYAAEAQHEGLAPSTYQAILWVTWKHLYPPTRKRWEQRSQSYAFDF